MLPHHGQSQTVQGDGSGLAQQDDGSVAPPGHIRGARQIAQKVIRRHREKDRQGKEPGKAVFLLRPTAVLVDGLLGKEQRQQGLSAVAGDPERHQRPGADAHIVIHKSPPGPKQQHPCQTSQSAGQDGNHHLHRLEHHKQQRPSAAAAGHKCRQPLLGGEDAGLPAPKRHQQADHHSSYRHGLQGRSFHALRHADTSSCPRRRAICAR